MCTLVTAGLMTFGYQKENIKQDKRDSETLILQKVKHKWPDNYSISKIEERYQCPDSDEGNSEDSLLIGRNCVNQQLYDTILKLSALMYQKYGTTRGMVVRGKMLVPSINFLDKDVELASKSTEG